MSSFVELKKTERKFEKIESLDKLFELFKGNLKDLVLYVKFDIAKTVIQISQILDDKGIIILTDPGYEPENNKIKAYGLLDKYFELELDVVEAQGPGLFRCIIKEAKRAAEVRKELRLKVTPEQVIASGFIISKHAIDISQYKIPTSIKVLLDQFHTDHSQLCDLFKVDVFEQGNPILEAIKKTGKILFVGDLSKPEEKNPTEEILNAKELFGEKNNEYIKKYIEKGYKSIIIAPIIYITDAGIQVPFAYAQLISKSKLFTLEDIDELKKLLAKLVNRIKDANTVMIHVNQQILNLSKSGAKIHITDENLKKYLPNVKGFTFNIIFKLQAPVTIYCEIKNLFRDDDGNMFVGVAFAGHSSRKDEMKRYSSFIDPMIKNYKEQLLKLRKKGIKQ